MIDNPYENADRAIKLLNRKAIIRFRDAKKKCALLKYDELNVIQTINLLYSELDTDNQKAFLSVAKYGYRNSKPHGRNEPDMIWLLAFLDEYDAVTKYRYTTEIQRKEQYTQEAVIAATAKSIEFQRGLRYWSRMTAHYADSVTDAAVIKAYKDAGVKKVRWITQEDERVCGECNPRDGKVYDIDKVPPKPHWGCRCYLVAVDGG